MGARADALTAEARGGKPRPPADDVVARSSRSSQSLSLAAVSFWELQLNLCNSGFAACWTGGDAVFEGGDLIYYLSPDLVTLNEICLNDLPSYLQPSLAASWPDDWTYYVFQPAIDKRTGEAFKCLNGDEFGSAVLGRVPAGVYQGVNAWGGVYAAQDSSSNEQRTFACAYAIGNHFACTTHLATNEPIALAQCRALMFDAVPYIMSVEGASGKTIVGGDLNLEYDTSDPENVQNCVPNGYTRKGDGDVQHVIFSNDITFETTQVISMLHTDHPAFLVKLSKP